jgi:hypothetical protein
MSRAKVEYMCRPGASRSFDALTLSSLTPWVCGSCSISVLLRKSFWLFCSPTYVEQHEQAFLEDRTDHGFAYTSGRGKVPKCMNADLYVIRFSNSFETLNSIGRTDTTETGVIAQ